jgi:hypothetical protein
MYLFFKFRVFTFIKRATESGVRATLFSPKNKKREKGKMGKKRKKGEKRVKRGKRGEKK